MLTVCAFSTNGTYNVADDKVADFSSAGPTAVDFGAKPDICAPGVGIVSTAAPGSTLFQTRAARDAVVAGCRHGLDRRYAYLPYESLTGTSMATPLVSGAVALMLQANPNLTPNLIKGILEYTAISKPGVSPLRQGAGFMNVSHAVALAALAAQPSTHERARFRRPGPATSCGATTWSAAASSTRRPTPGASASNGAGRRPTLTDGDNIVWGTMNDGDNIVWGTATDGDNIVWGTASDGDNIVWGTATDGDNIVWGTDCGGADCDNIVWGTAPTATTSSGARRSDGDNIVWGTATDGDNIVWGTASDGDNIVWGTANLTNIVWPIFKGGK